MNDLKISHNSAMNIRMARSIRRFHFESGLFLLIIALFCFLPSLAWSETLKETRTAGLSEENSLLRRIVLIGASASAGFTMREPLGGTNTLKLQLHRYIDAAIRVPHEPVRNFASTMFFMQPEAQAQMQVERVIKARPTLVVAPDFLFWFCYGEGTNDAHRLARFETGLKLLETISSPIVVGDIPDCSAAVNGILDAEEIPSANAIRAANQRLKQWVATRSRVAVVPVASFVELSMAGKSVAVHGDVLPSSEARRLLQSDRLHPTPLGDAVLALMLLDGARASAGIHENEVRWSYKEVLSLGLAEQVAVSTNRVKTAMPENAKPTVSESSLPRNGQQGM